MAGIGYVKRKIKLNYLENKPERYKVMQLTYPQVSYEQLVEEVAQSRGVNTNQTRAVVDALLNRLVHYMEIGHGVSLGSFGSFKPTITVKSVKILDEADASTVKVRKVRFFPGKEFKQMLQNLEVRDYETLDYSDE